MAHIDASKRIVKKGLNHRDYIDVMIRLPSKSEKDRLHDGGSKKSQVSSKEKDGGNTAIASSSFIMGKCYYQTLLWYIKDVSKENYDE